VIEVEQQTHGLPASGLPDADLERQVSRAHATRNWVFFHGTAGQYRKHTERMLELEQEYLRRHPQRTWQGVGTEEPPADAEERIHQIRELLRLFQSEMDWLVAEFTTPSRTAPGEKLADAEAQLLARFAAQPDGRMHKLEAHQAARRLGIYPSQLATLYRRPPPLLAVVGKDRVLTETGRNALNA